MLRRLRKIAPSMLAIVAVLLWGLAGAVPAAHGAMPKPASQSAQGHAHDHASDHGHDRGPGAQAADVCDPANDQDKAQQDRCCPPGCSFAAVTPAPFGAVTRALVSAPVFRPDSVAPESGAAPPLRPPRLS